MPFLGSHGDSLHILLLERLVENIFVRYDALPLMHHESVAER